MISNDLHRYQTMSAKVGLLWTVWRCCCALVSHSHSLMWKIFCTNIDLLLCLRLRDDETWVGWMRPYSNWQWHFDYENALCSASDRCDVCKSSLPSTLHSTPISIRRATSLIERIELGDARDLMVRSLS